MRLKLGVTKVVFARHGSPDLAVCVCCIFIVGFP